MSANLQLRLRLARTPRFKIDDCLHDGFGECVYTQCRYHLEHAGTRQRNPTARPVAVLVKCSLQVAEQGPQSWETIGQLLGGLTRQAVQQTEWRAIKKLRAAAIGLRGDLDV
jgi:hypothetical protein